ncbi:MAG: hypothetical protein F2697_02770, partial [Actinobacteria bacterium]|nr:hypothetical protein [Actinomycetota bacterium]
MVLRRYAAERLNLPAQAPRRSHRTVLGEVLPDRGIDRCRRGTSRRSLGRIARAGQGGPSGIGTVLGADVGTRLTESALYRHAWTTPALDAVFGESHRLQSWLDILTALAQAQEDFGLVPSGVADELRVHARVEDLDLEAIAEETRRTSHSTLGLIHGLQRVLPEHAREYVYFGATVQDLTDTWFGIAMRDSTTIIRADLVRVELACIQLALAHRDSPMAGRTHGQPGTPITFGFKAATWADEISRAIDR